MVSEWGVTPHIAVLSHTMIFRMKRDPFSLNRAKVVSPTTRFFNNWDHL